LPIWSNLDESWSSFIHEGEKKAQTILEEPTVLGDVRQGLDQELAASLKIQDATSWNFSSVGDIGYQRTLDKTDEHTTADLGKADQQAAPAATEVSPDRYIPKVEKLAKHFDQTASEFEKERLLDRSIRAADISLTLSESVDSIAPHGENKRLEGTEEAEIEPLSAVLERTRSGALVLPPGTRYSLGRKINQRARSISLTSQTVPGFSTGSAWRSATRLETL
jgi:hypothetical protein